MYKTGAVNVWLDGEIIEEVIALDTKNQWVEYLWRDCQGKLHYYLDEKSLTFKPITEVRYGKVEMIRVYPQETIKQLIRSDD